MTRWKKIVPAVAVAVALITGTALAAENFNTGETTHSQAATEAAVSGGAVASGPAAGGNAPQGTPPSGQKPDGTPPAGGPEGQGGAPGGAPGGQSSSGVSSYDSVKSITSDTTLSDTSVSSTGKDENAIHVSGGAKANLNNVTATRNSSNSTGGDNSSFYGVGAAILTTEGTTTINGGKITTDAAGGAGVFSYGTGVTYVSNTTISTKQDTSGGIHVAGGGTLYAWALNVATNGQSAAAIRSDRGGGKMVVNGGTYTSNGVGSPAIYSTADIAVNKATLTANSSEAICIEGLNSIHLYDTALTGNKNQRGWGSTGSNGADCLFTGISQTMTGDVVWDSVSKLDFYMTDGSTLTGAVKDDESCAGRGGSGYCNLYISKDSKWVVTGDSTLTKLTSAGTIVDKSGKTVTVKGTDGTVYVQGTSDVTVTVGSYCTTVDLSGASKATSFSNASHELKMPLTIIEANTEVLEMDQVELYEPQARSWGIRIHPDVAPGIVYRGQEEEIRRLFGILFDNAMKYSTKDTEFVITLRRKNRRCRMTFTNETEQVVKGNQDILFERFYRSDASRNSATGGSGIGLAIARAICENHGGSIQAESKDGHSLTITVVL